MSVYWPLADRRGPFAVARRRDNLFVGEFCPFVAVRRREIRLEYWPLTDPESRALALAGQDGSAFEPAPAGPAPAPSPLSS